MKLNIIKALAVSLACLSPTWVTAETVDEVGIFHTKEFKFPKFGYFVLDYGVKDIDGTLWVCGRGLNRTTGWIDKTIEQFMASMHVRVDGKTVFSDVSNFAVVSSTRRYEVTERVCHPTSLPYSNAVKVSLRLDGTAPGALTKYLNGRAWRE